MASNITGRLINAVRQPRATGYVVTGEIYEDQRGRFFDGSLITTSPVSSEEGNIILTLNSIYEVESWACVT